MTAELEATNKRAGDLQEKVDGMSSVLSGMNERCHQLKSEKEANERALKEAVERANLADRQCAQLQADLEANKETTQNLQSQLDEVFTDLISIKALQENLDRKSQVRYGFYGVHLGHIISTNFTIVSKAYSGNSKVGISHKHKDILNNLLSHI